MLLEKVIANIAKNESLRIGDSETSSWVNVSRILRLKKCQQLPQVLTCSNSTTGLNEKI